MNFAKALRRIRTIASGPISKDTPTEAPSDQSNVPAISLFKLIEGLNNLSNLFNHRFRETIAGIANQSGLLNERFREVIAGIDNQSGLFNERFREVIAGIDNQSRLLDEKMRKMIERQDQQLELQKAEITLIHAFLTARASQSSDLSSIQLPPLSELLQGSTKSAFEAAVGRLPLLIDHKTYNTSHPQYDATLVRNFPGRILNADKPCSNSVYAELKKLANADGKEIPDNAWDSVLAHALEEAKTVPHAEQVFERRAFIEKYMAELTRKYQAHYAAGWVNLDDALFLYWLVRQLKPKTIVQTGVCNGLSSAFMMLALVKNGPDGRLHVVDMPPIFNSKDPVWTIKGKVYGVVIPEGKTPGWIVPDAYRNRFEVWSGDAKILLPKLVDKVDTIDLFYHDSDHTYDHMMFEFREAKRKLRPGGLIVGDDISWNASVWDFADEHGVPSYNFKGAVGVAFF